MPTFYNDLDYYLGQHPNMFRGGGQKPQGTRQNYVERSQNQFLQEFANVERIKEKTREAVERVPKKRGRLQKNNVMKNKDFVKKHTDSFVQSAQKMSTAEAKARQRQLKEMGLYTGAIDGKWGPKSIAANEAAMANGVAWNGGNYQISRDNFEPGIGDEMKRMWNAYSASNPVTRFMFEQPYYGTEEDARKLGYKTFVDRNGYEHDVDYGSAVMGNLSTRDRAARQMEMYGITDEMTANKSGFDRFLYENLPSYSYDVAQTLSNAFNGTKQADSMTGRSVMLPEREGTTNEAERNATPFRESLRNLAFHYPDPNGRLRVSPYERPGQGEFDLGYAFYDPEVQNYILNDPIYQQTTPGGKPVQAGIVSNYYDPTAVAKFAVQQMKGNVKTDDKNREYYLNDNNQRVYRSGPAISTVQNSGEGAALGDYGYGAWSASQDAQGRRVAYDKWDLQLGPFNIPGFELYYKGK